MTAPDGPGLTCPACGSRDFRLPLGGRQSGQVSCAACGLAFASPEPAVRPADLEAQLGAELAQMKGATQRLNRLAAQRRPGRPG